MDDGDHDLVIKPKFDFVQQMSIIHQFSISLPFMAMRAYIMIRVCLAQLPVFHLLTEIKCATADTHNYRQLVGGYKLYPQ